MTDEEQLVGRMARSVICTAAEYLDTHEDYADVLKHRPHDLTRRIDMVAEEALNRAVSDEGIAARIISEELGERIVPASGQPEFTLVLDPIDGSNNAISGIPYFCTSLALSKKTSGATFGDIDAAAVASIAGGTFSAQKGEGARLDGKPIWVRERPEKPRYAIYVYDAGPIPRGIIALQEERCVVRTMGSIALDLCMLARGSLDVVVDTRRKLSGYDILAGALILREAGGVITGVSNECLGGLPADATGISIVAAVNEQIHSRIVKKLG